MAKTMGVSPITGTIFYGTVKNDKWVGNREDVTDIAIKAVFEWFMHMFKDECKNGGAYQIRFPEVPYVLEMKMDYESCYNKGNDCDACEKSYIYNGDCIGCKCKDEESECQFSS